MIITLLGTPCRPVCLARAAHVDERHRRHQLTCLFSDRPSIRAFAKVDVGYDALHCLGMGFQGGIGLSGVTNFQAHTEQARSAFASNAERALKADVVNFPPWCRLANTVPMPTAPETVALFINAVDEQRAPTAGRRSGRHQGCYCRPCREVDGQSFRVRGESLQRLPKFLSKSPRRRL
jgi:hypothetical protein